MRGHARIIVACVAKPRRGDATLIRSTGNLPSIQAPIERSTPTRYELASRKGLPIGKPSWDSGCFWAASCFRCLGMTKPSTRHERRGRNRPAVGDWTSCPTCAFGMMLFTAQYHPRNSSDSPRVAMPAWVCDHCPNVVFVRAEHQPSALRQNAKNLRAAASRTLMKSRFVRSRADKALKKSLSHKRRRD